nr:F-box domain, leucine-rich repeat domain, L domain-like protein [Tanacetum cinerariifolium]
MRRLEAMGTYTDDEINRLARGGKQRGHIAGVGRVLSARGTASPSTPAHDSTLNSLHNKVDFMMSIFKSDSKYSDMFLQFESSGASGSGKCEDEEEGADHQDDEDEDDFPRRHVAVENVPPWHLILDWKIRETHLFTGDCRWGRNPLQAFPSDVSPATSRRGKKSLATSRRGKPQIVAGEST